MNRALVILALMLPVLASAQVDEVPFYLENQRIDVTTQFTGTHARLTTFLGGNTNAAAPKLAYVLVGPPADLVFRRKARRAGMWVNSEKETLGGAASYVALIGFSRDEFNLACLQNRLQSLASENAADLSWVCNAEFRELMAGKGLFQRVDDETAIQNLGNGFFRISTFIPPTAKPGTYQGRFLARRVGFHGPSAETTVEVRRAGLERLVVDTANNSRLFYGLLCLFLAGLAGYVTNLIFSRRA